MWKNLASSSSAEVDKKAKENLMLNTIGNLTSQDKYLKWSTSMMIILKGIKAFEIMVHGVCPAEEADTTEVDACDHIGHTASN
jgi:hypothetical protein